MEFLNIKNRLTTAREASKIDFANFVNNGKIAGYGKYNGVRIDNTYTNIMLTEKQQQKTEAEQKAIIIKKEHKRIDKKADAILARITEIENTTPNAGLKIDVEWKKSANWGYCPNANIYSWNYEASNRATAKSSGCGYDKLSTVTADLLNSDNSILNVVLTAYEKAITADNTIKDVEDVLYYGISGNIIDGLQLFDGGVGVSCHIAILRKLGYSVTHNSGSNYDYIEAMYTVKEN